MLQENSSENAVPTMDAQDAYPRCTKRKKNRWTCDLFERHLLNVHLLPMSNCHRKLERDSAKHSCSFLRVVGVDVCRRYCFEGFVRLWFCECGRRGLCCISAIISLHPFSAFVRWAPRQVGWFRKAVPQALVTSVRRTRALVPPVVDRCFCLHSLEEAAARSLAVRPMSFHCHFMLALCRKEVMPHL